MTAVVVGRNAELGALETFVSRISSGARVLVLEGTLTVDLGEPPERHELERGSVLVVQPGQILQLRNAGDEELVLFIYGAPPVSEGADFFDDVP